MTIIFGFSRGDVPLLVGDVLLTRAGTEEQLAQLPIRKVPQSLASEFGIVISGLRQKVNILHEQVAFAWAGDFLAARLLARDISIAINRDGMSLRTVQETIIREQNEIGDLSFILICLEHGTTHYLYQNVQGRAVKRFENLRFAGSGSRFLIETLKSLDRFEPDYSPDNFVMGLGEAVVIMSQCLGKELFLADNLVERWGGSFEICFPVRGKLLKLDKLAFVHFVFDEAQSEINLELVTRLALNRYRGTVLECRVVEVDKTADKNEFLVLSDKTTAILPLITSELQPSQPLSSEFDYEHLIVNLSCMRDRRQVWSTSVVASKSDKGGPLNVKIAGATARITIAHEFGERIRAQVRKMRDLPTTSNGNNPTPAT